MKKILMMAVAAGVLMSPTFAMAQDFKGGGKNKERMEALKNMSPEERKELMETKRAQWQSMSEEEREAKRAEYKAKHEARKAEMDAKYDTLTDEQKAKVDAKRAKHKAKREQMKERGMGGMQSRGNFNLNQ
ncbi:MAG: hypothetical protein GW903_04635 [Alphaproteobacteria bacterium]|nr:hypothetical protein [Alphaproteobacteria bacterium]NCQ88257.1 hypothetical protein [Alphaproteobacteria bacterium]NCT05236.1 hypothetical protein [Alphaproteobacteria bacterium]